MMRLTVVFVGFFLALVSAGGGAAEPLKPSPEQNAAAARLQADAAFLADDARAGREAGTAGYAAAADYVVAQMAAAGLKPGADGAWRQIVPLETMVLQEGSARLTFKDAAGEAAFDADKDFVIRPVTGATTLEASAPVVYVGYGIVDPLARRNDYLDIDVERKIVAVLEGAPTSFSGDERAYLGSSANKVRTARAHGAIGVLFLRTPSSTARSAWRRLVHNQYHVAMDWRDADQESEETSALAAATLSRKAAERLFRRAPMEYAGIYGALKDGGVAPQGFALGASVSIRATFSSGALESPNIVGLIEGVDPRRSDEVIIVTAHLDHVGVDETDAAEDGSQSGEAMDRIYNGALDNALGVAVLLETARALAAAQKRPRRTIAFVATTAEEKGLIGADYLARRPPFAGRRIVGNVNIDMPLLLFPFTDVIAFGAERSTIGTAVAEAAARHSVGLTADPVEHEGLFVRSDHFRFVEQGVPSVFLFVGFSDGGAKIFKDFMKTHYHQPSDDLNLQIDYKSATRFAALNTSLIEILANAADAPLWRPHDFFALMFGGRFDRDGDEENTGTPAATSPQDAGVSKAH